MKCSVRLDGSIARLALREAPVRHSPFTSKVVKSLFRLTVLCCLAASPALAVDYTVPATPYKVAAADLNGDGAADLAVSCFSGNKVQVLINNGFGGFASGSSLAVTKPYAIAIGQLNKDTDSFPDIAVGRFVSTGAQVLIFHGDGTGGFSATPDVTLAVGAAPAAIAIGDLNGDGRDDIVVVSRGSNQLQVFLQNPDGTFTAKTPITTASAPQAVALGHFNNDAFLDIAVAHFGSADLGVFLNDGAANFTQVSPVYQLPSGADSRFMAAGSLDGGAQSGLVVTHFGLNEASVLFFDTTGKVDTARSYNISGLNSPAGVVLADVNGDGFPDLGIAEYGGATVDLFTGNGTGGFTPAGTDNVGTSPFGLAAGHFRDPTVSDLAVANSGSNSVSVLLVGDLPGPKGPAGPAGAAGPAGRLAPQVRLAPQARPVRQAPQARPEPKVRKVPQVLPEPKVFLDPQVLRVPPVRRDLQVLPERRDPLALGSSAARSSPFRPGRRSHRDSRSWAPSCWK